VSRSAAGLLAFATAVSYLDFAWIRQTFCKYLCPYARFQSVLFDRDTLVVAYDPIRGEPRGKRGSAKGACVDCGLCVEACPTGIDIRRGMQLECIACTQCIDACNAVMDRLGRAPNLIGYRSLVGLERSRRVRILRPRVLVYAAMGSGLALVLVTGLARRPLLALDVAHGGGSGAPYQRIADGRIANAYRLFIQNRDDAEHHYRISIDAPGDLELVAGQNPVPVAAASELEARVFVVAAAGGPTARPLAFRVEPLDATSRSVERTAVFLEPSAEPGEGENDDG
jgi:cytochrome c oxidase accessory protein FixG